MTLDLDKMEAVAKAATPGPWIKETTQRNIWIGPSKAAWPKVADVVVHFEVGVDFSDEANTRYSANSAHIVTFAPPAVLALIAQARRARELGAENANLRQQAESWAMEARCHRSSLHEAYQHITGATGEPGNWNGARPIIKAFDALRARIRKLERALQWYGEQARLARLIHSEGDAGRHALANDGGTKALNALRAAREVKS